MTSTPTGPLDEPVDAAGSEDAASSAPVSGSPAEADADVGYSRGATGESPEQAGDAATEGGGTDYLDTDTLMGGPGDPRNG